MSEKPKVDPLLAAGPPPGTRLRDPEAPKPSPKGGRKRRAVAAPTTSPSPSAADTPTDPSTTPSTFSVPSSSPVVGELVEPGALAPAAAQALGEARPKTKRERELERIARIDNQIRKDASRVVLHSLAAADIPDSGERPEGWSDRKWRAARDARMNRREGPSYIDHASKIYESFLRADALAKREGRVTPSLNAQISFYVRGDINNTYNYPVIPAPEGE